MIKDHSKMTAVELTSIKKSFGAVDVIKGVDLDIEEGEFVVFVGPSGCGKSTLLRLIAGLEDITSGTMKIGGEVVNDVPPSKRGIAMVFQSYALYPHMSVYNNMAFGMKLAQREQGGDRQARPRTRPRSCSSRPTSTACRRRSPAASASASRSAARSCATRRSSCSTSRCPTSTRRSASRPASRSPSCSESMPNTTMIYVTHDQVEAMTLADRIVVLNAGLIEQVGSPMELYLHPDNLFVARFIGSPAMNTVPCTIESGGATPTVKPQGGTVGQGRRRHPGQRQGAEGHLRRPAGGPRPSPTAATRSSPARCRSSRSSAR